MTVRNMTPDSVVLQQVQEHWQKLFALMLWKLRGREAVTLSFREIEEAHADFAAQGLTLLMHGRTDSLLFQLVDRARAERLAAHDNSMRGTA